MQEITRVTLAAGGRQTWSAKYKKWKFEIPSKLEQKHENIFLLMLRQHHFSNSLFLDFKNSDIFTQVQQKRPY